LPISTVAADVVESFDDHVDSFLAPLRGHLLPDALASTLSFLGDHGAIWLVLCLARARRPGPHRVVALRALLFTGSVAPSLNAALKVTVGRVRPRQRSGSRALVRIPRTASFPSGHALAAWCAATLLAEDDPLAPAYFGLAAAISLSRVHVRLHHATDALGGAVIGTALGAAGRLMFRWRARPRTPGGRRRAMTRW
jgi:membrane-associated phospholipid phosphatase